MNRTYRFPCPDVAKAKQEMRAESIRSASLFLIAMSRHEEALVSIAWRMERD